MKLSSSEIDDLVEEYDRESKAIKEELIQICWYMRGSISYPESLMLDQNERELVARLVKKNLETTKESGLPFF